MGILFVLLFWGVVASIFAAIGTLIARSLVTLLTRNVSNDAQKLARYRVTKVATAFPIGCVVWAGLVFIFQGVINTIYLHRDIGIGDSSYCPLPNGYSLLMIDVSDRGTIVKTQNFDGVVSNQPISGIRKLQVSGTHLLGGSDSKYDEHFGQDNPSIDRYFLFNTQSGEHVEFVTEDKLRVAASHLGIALKLEPIFDVYRRYRFTWFDATAVALLLLPPIITLAFLMRWVIRIRKMQSHLGGAV